MRYCSLGGIFQTWSCFRHISGLLYKYCSATLKEAVTSWENAILEWNMPFNKNKKCVWKIKYIFKNEKNKHNLTAWGFKWTCTKELRRLLFWFTSWNLYHAKSAQQRWFQHSVAIVSAATFHSAIISAYPPHNVAFHDKSRNCATQNCFKVVFLFQYKRVLHLEFNIKINMFYKNLIHSVYLFLNKASVLSFYPR